MPHWIILSHEFEHAIEDHMGRGKNFGLFMIFFDAMFLLPIDWYGIRKRYRGELLAIDAEWEYIYRLLNEIKYHLVDVLEHELVELLEKKQKRIYVEKLDENIQIYNAILGSMKVSGLDKQQYVAVIKKKSKLSYWYFLKKRLASKDYKEKWFWGLLVGIGAPLYILYFSGSLDKYPPIPPFDLYLVIKLLFL